MSNEFYTSAFTSKDFVEGDEVERAEVFVVVGKGEVTEIKDSKAGKSKQIIIDAHKEYQGEALFSKGWVPNDSEIVKKAEEALKNNTPVEFRIETVRNKDVDRTIPISELKSDMQTARKSVMNSMARIKFEDENTWVEGIMRTNPKEDKIKTGRTALDLSEAELSGSENKKSSQQETTTYNNSFEPAPWKTLTKDNTVNPGSIAVSVPITINSFIHEQEKEKGFKLNTKKRLMLSHAILLTTNKLQLAIYDGKLEKPDLSLGSHSRARALVFETIKINDSLTEDVASSKENLHNFIEETQKTALELWKWSITEIEKIENVN